MFEAVADLLASFWIMSLAHQCYEHDKQKNLYQWWLAFIYVILSLVSLGMTFFTHG